jgi:hypothetical protein
MTFAIHIAVPSNPQKPNTPAINAMIRNSSAQRNISKSLIEFNVIIDRPLADLAALGSNRRSAQRFFLTTQLVPAL